MNIKRPAFRYYGGKARIAQWIIAQMPAHKIYVEPCGGAASVLLQKPESPVEVYNDIDLQVLNFFTVLRESTDELIRRIELTPYHRREYDEAMVATTDDPIENARLFFVRQTMGIGAGTNHSGGFRRTTGSSRHNPARTSSKEVLLDVARRLSGVQFECQDALSLIPDYSSQDTLIYFDPPYILDTRSKKNAYRFEQDNSWHRTASELLIDSKSHVIVSGYNCPLYAELYEKNGFVRMDKKANTTGQVERIESIWLSPSIAVGRLF